MADPKRKHVKPPSLHPLSPEEALGAAMKIPPPKDSPRRAKKKKKRKRKKT